MFGFEGFILDHLRHKQMKIGHENPKDFIILLIGQLGLHVVTDLLPDRGQRAIVIYLKKAQILILIKFVRQAILNCFTHLL